MLDDAEVGGDFNEEVESLYIEATLGMLDEMKSSKNLQGQNQTWRSIIKKCWIEQVKNSGTYWT